LVDASFDLKVDLDRRDKERRSKKKEKDDKHLARKIMKPEITVAYARRRKKHVNPPETSNKAMNSKPTGKNVVTEELRPRPRVTRAKKKYRLNSKSILKPSLKKTSVIDVDSDTPAKPAKKKRVKFNISTKGPLLQLAEAAETVEKKEEKGEHGKEATKMVDQHNGRRRRGKGSTKTFEQHDGKGRRGKRSK